ncbi:DUF4279 domain-containing protein [Deinococcus aluminii]|uniref:DUF4279 domain-containing protein n=1 Tax=Deinococcus aluminii TaxID=1656885 RepID=UPI0031ED578F
MTEEAPENGTEPRLRVYLSIRGDFDPLAFSVTVGLSGDWTMRRGEHNPARGVPRCDAWAIEVAERHSYDVEAMVEELLMRLTGHEDRIAATVRAWDLDASLIIVAYWNIEESSSPALGLSTEQMACLARLGAVLDVDLYARCSDCK